MCAECGMNPCHPRCPNAPEPVPVHECVKCGYGILVGDKFWDSPEGKICEECVDDMSAEEILKLCGESLTEAERRKGSMAEQNAVATQQGTQLSVAAQVKSMISQDAVKKKFTEVLGQKAPQFLASITNVVAGSAQLKKCPATTIMSAAFVAATYDLPIDSNLGFAAIVPYNNNKYNQQTRQWEKHPEAQFQMMYKGFIQLAIRSGYYEKMNCSVVYKDELVSYNPITGEVEFVTDFSKCTQRAEGKSENIAGYYAWFKLLTGFRKELFMTTAEVENHARKYSTAYRYDLENNKKGSKWTTDFEAMALKTVIKMLLSKWGILSVDMQRAIQDDQKVYDEDGEGSYGDNQPDIVEAQDPFGNIEQKEEEQQIGGLDLEEVE